MSEQAHAAKPALREAAGAAKAEARAAAGASAGLDPRHVLRLPRAEDRQATFRASVARRNETGLPDRLKAGLESLSGFSMHDVKVHFGSSKPARLGALAYAKGKEIHLAPGQERHLPHEAWHVVQQKRGRVRPNRLLAGIAINDDPRLEGEADRFGSLAETAGQSLQPPAPSPKGIAGSVSGVFQLSAPAPKAVKKDASKVAKASARDQARSTPDHVFNAVYGDLAAALRANRGVLDSLEAAIVVLSGGAAQWSTLRDAEDLKVYNQHSANDANSVAYGGCKKAIGEMVAAIQVGSDKEEKLVLVAKIGEAIVELFNLAYDAVAGSAVQKRAVAKVEKGKAHLVADGPVMAKLVQDCLLAAIEKDLGFGPSE
ncbi:MAG TPA: DUF4157 domain-containing protein [Allosphingosinicella sp.]